MAKIRENLKGRTLEEALKRTIEYCNGQGILVKFLKENALEVVNMLDTQFTFEDAVKVWKDEAREEGMEEGLEKGMEKGREETRKILANNLRKMGMTEEQIVQALRGE